jgi:hypothetical protein
MRDREFCNADHRKSYGQRLGKCLQLVAVPEPDPPYTAGFLSCYAMQTGQPRSVTAPRMGIAGPRALETAAEWPLRIPRASGSELTSLPPTAPNAPVSELTAAAAGFSGPAIESPQITPRAIDGALAPIPAQPDSSQPAEGGETAEPVAPPQCGNWMRAGRAEPAAREVRAIQSPAVPWPSRVNAMPAFAAFQIAQTGAAAPLQMPAPEAADAASRLSNPAAKLIPSLAAALPEFPGVRPALNRPAQAEGRGPMPIESLIASAGLHLAPAASPAVPPEIKPAALNPVPPAPPLQVPELQAPSGDASQIPPPAGFIPLEFYSHRTKGGTRLQLSAIPARTGIAPPAFCLEIAGTLADCSNSSTRALASKPAARVITMPVAAAAAPTRVSPEWRIRFRAVGTVAAGLIVGLGIWTGASGAWRSLQTHAVKQEAAEQYAAELPAAPSPAPVVRTAAPAPGPARGPLGWIRNTVVKRAAVELSDSFTAGMESWGVPAKSWAPGWSRSADGYVRPGQMALFRPSQGYRDYRLEFFAQIEDKSVGWVVRARDKRNYYAMKFTVLDPGPRTVVAIVHYPVVGGKAGRRVEVPLSAMIHKREGIHVAVEVKGNRVVTSLQGQEVDSWTDETLASGGVGFFSEAGERARLYWMKVAANDDLLGRICARVAGVISPASQQTATAPAGSGSPFGPSPAESKEAVLAAAIGYVQNRRKQKWNS